MVKSKLYYLWIFCLTAGVSWAQETREEKLANSIFALKTYEQQEHRHIAINDSFNRNNLFKAEFAYLIFADKKAEAINNKRLHATILISLGNFYLGQGNYIKGIETFNRSAAIFESLNEYSGLSTVRANLGNAYFYVHDLEKAELYYKKAVADYVKIEHKKPDSETKLANYYNSLGSIYCSKRDYLYGRTYFDLAYAIWKKHGDSLSIAYIFNNYANVFYELKKMDSALIYFKKALQLKLSHGDNFDKSDAYNNLADFYKVNDQPQKAIEFGKKGLNFLDTTVYSRQLINAYYNLNTAYHDLKDHKNELRYYKKYKEASDSANIQFQQSQISRIELKHEFDRVHLSDSIKAVEDIKLKDMKIAEKRTQSYFLIFILLLTIVALSLIYSRFKLTKKQKQIIEQKNKEITDSINYARKIQQSILPNEKHIEREIKRLSGKSNGA